MKSMKAFLCAGAAALTLLPSLAGAQDSSVINRQNRGFYLGLGGGLNLETDNDFRGAGTDSKASYEPGYAAIGSIGYAFGNGLRLELEPGYRRNNVDTINGLAGTGHTEIASGMVNAIYDFDIRTPVVPLVPHLGAGIGYAHAWNRSVPHNGLQVDGSDDALAYQAIAGVEYAISPGLKLGFDYRWFVANDVNFRESTTALPVHVGDLESHTVLFTIRYELGTPSRPQPQPAAYTPPAPTPAPTAQPAQAPAAPRNFTVYFDYNSPNLSDSATPIVDEAAESAKRGNVTRIAVTGHADRSGSDNYNQRLSERRANAVRDELVRHGVPGNEIAVTGRGESEPAVPTPDGVREPRNRRVEIVLQSAGA